MHTLSNFLDIFNYQSAPDTMAAVDSTVASCYRALGPNRKFHYAILRFTLTNDQECPITRSLLILERQLHGQLATALNTRHLRFSSFVIDARDHGIAVTFTLLDNPPMLNQSLDEPSSFELIQRLAAMIDNERLLIRLVDPSCLLAGLPSSLQTLVFNWANKTAELDYRHGNQTLFIYQNVTKLISHSREKILRTSRGPTIAALWTGFALLGLIITLTIGSFITIRNGRPLINMK
jgi:hypothetical protein